MGRGKGEKVSIEAAQAARAGVTAALDLGHSKIACFIMKLSRKRPSAHACAVRFKNTHYRTDF